MSINTTAIKERAGSVASVLRRFSVLIFLFFLLGVYGFLGLRIVSLNQIEPDTSIVAAKLKSAGVPHIDQDALDKIQQLQDNSVEVQSLFDKARSNPFQE